MKDYLLITKRSINILPGSETKSDLEYALAQWSAAVLLEGSNENIKALEKAIDNADFSIAENADRYLRMAPSQMFTSKKTEDKGFNRLLNQYFEDIELDSFTKIGGSTWLTEAFKSKPKTYSTLFRIVNKMAIRNIEPRDILKLKEDLGKHVYM